MANGMTGLYVGSSGLRSAQTALNTTAHNLANVNVKGYTRQQVALSSAEYFKIGQTTTQDKSYGVGVDTLAIRRVRDDLIDAAYRQENGRLGYYSTQYDAVVEIESLFGELNGVTFEDSLKDLKNAINELSYEPESTIKRSALIQMSTTFIDRASSIYKGLKDYQTTLNTKVSNTVDRINELGETISSLNKKITQVELSGERANDLRDQRDKALDELSAYAKVTYQETDNKTLLVTLEGFSFVTSFGVNKMGTEDIDGTGLLRPVWEAFNNRAVFNDFEEITAINNNDIGELKGLLLARGNTTADYTDVPVRPEAKDYAGGDTDPQYLADYAQYEKDAEYYNKYIEPSVILSTMAGFDKLVNGIVTSLNDILCPQTTYDSATKLTYTDNNGNTKEIPGCEEITNADGSKTYRYKVLDKKKSSVGMDDNETMGTELFSRKNTERYIKINVNGEDMYVFNTQNQFGSDSDYTLGNIEVNPTASQHKELIPLSKKNDGGEDMDKAMELLEAWNVKFAAISPSKYAKEDFMSFYDSVVANVATTGEVLKGMVNTQTSMADGYDSQRMMTESVSSEEELQNMIKYQQAYNAASRYINVVDQMLEHIVTRLGS